MNYCSLLSLHLLRSNCSKVSGLSFSAGYSDQFTQRILGGRRGGKNPLSLLNLIFNKMFNSIPFAFKIQSPQSNSPGNLPCLRNELRCLTTASFSSSFHKHERLTLQSKSKNKLKISTYSLTLAMPGFYFPSPDFCCTAAFWGRV